MEELSPDIVNLKLGSQIDISSDKINGIFLITYIDDEKMKIENETDTFLLHITDNRIPDIKNIIIIKNPEEEGYARQNGLLEGTLIDITFNVDGEMEHVIGEIIGLEEDCIEIRVEDDTIYIDFGYIGIPENLNISEIEIIDAKPKPKIPSAIEDGDKIGELIFNGKMKEITEYVIVDSSRKKFSLEDQTNDMLSDMLSSIPENDRTPDTLNNLYTIIERYVQLRKDFSIIDEDGNVSSYIKRGANYRPLVHSLMEFKKSLYWLIPVTEIIKKNLFEFDENDIMVDINNVDMKNLNDITTTYLTINSDNRYADYTKELQDWFTPFLQKTENARNIIYRGVIKDNFKVLVNNFGNFESTVVNCAPERKGFGKLAKVAKGDIACRLTNTVLPNILSIRYNDSTEYLNPAFFENNGNAQLIPLFSADSIYLKSLIFLPEPFVQFSKVSLPGTDIMTKANMGRFFINYYKLFENRIQPINVTPYLSNAVSGSIYQSKFKDGINIPENKFLNNIKNYSLVMRELKDEDIFEKYLTEIIPQTKKLFQMMKKYINGKLSIVQIIKTLEPFLIYSDDITFQQYNEMSEFLNTEVTNYIKLYNEKSAIFKKLKNYEPRDCPNILINILDDIPLANYAYKYDAYTNLSPSEFLSIAITTDYGDVYNNKLRFDDFDLTNVDLSGNIKKIVDTYSKSENYCKAIKIAKRYNNIDDLHEDNYKAIFYDKEFDKTPYFLLSQYEKEKNVMLEDKFYIFMEGILNKDYSIVDKEAQSVLRAFRYGKREIEDEGVYAVLFNKVEDKLNYYSRVDNAWKLDPTIENQPITDDLSCILQDTCLVTNSECLSDNVAKEELVKSTLKTITNNFDASIALTKHENEEYTEKLLTSSETRVKFLKKIKSYELTKYNNFQYNLGREVVDEQIIVSPYAKLCDDILGEIDIVKKYNYILQFVDEYTFTMEKDSRENSKLQTESLEFEKEDLEDLEDAKKDLEKDLEKDAKKDLEKDREKAESEPERRYKFVGMNDYKFNDEEFTKYIKEKNDESHWLYCIETQTKLIPKFFYILAKTFVDTPSEYLQRLDKLCNTIGKLSEDGDKYVDKYSGYTIRNIDFMKEYGSEELDIRVDTEPSKISGQPKKIVNIVNALETTMHVFLNELPLIVSIVENLLESVPSEEEFTKNMKEKREKNPKIKLETYKNRVNTLTLDYTLSAFIFALQVHNPTVKFRSVPGCGKGKISDEDKLIEYIVCIAKKMSVMVEPWNTLVKTTPEILAKRIKFTISQFSNLSPQVKIMMLERDGLKETIEDDDEIHHFTRWEHFLPAIVPFKLNTLSPITDIRVSQLSSDIKRGNIRQNETILSIKSKIIFYSYLFQQKIQEVISGQTLLFYTKKNVPFLDNACCSSENTESTLMYFMNDPKVGAEIKFLNEQVKELKNILNYNFTLSKSSIFCSDIDTKNARLLTNPTKYSEKIITRYLMLVNKFANMADSDEVYKHKVGQMSEFQFSEENFLGSIFQTESINTIMYDPPLSMETQLKDLLPPNMKAIKENMHNERDLNNSVFTANKKYIDDIVDFINESKLPKAAKKNVSILKELMAEDWEGFFVNRITLLKNYVYLFSRVFPNIIINGVEQNNLIHDYWNLSLPHSTKISEFCVNYYQPLQKFESKINDLLKIVMDETADIYEISMKTPYIEQYSTLLMNVNYLLAVLHKYISIEIDVETEDIQVINDHNPKEVVASLIIEYLIYIKKSKELQNKSYQSILDNNLLLKQTEKQAFRKRLEVMTIEKRNLDSELRKAGLGEWSKGTSKSVYKYVADDKKDELVQLLEEAENKRLREDSDVEMDSDLDEVEDEPPEYDEEQDE